jgi:FMN-dependent NADH-azoreductase
MNILHLDSSARKDESVSRKLAKDLVNNLKKDNDKVTYRDISNNIPFVAGIKGAGFIIPEEERNEEDKNYLNFQMNW